MRASFDESFAISAEEADAVQASGAALLQLSARLNGTKINFPFAEENEKYKDKEEAEDFSFVSLRDGAGFLDLLRDVVSHYAPPGKRFAGDSAGRHFVTALRHVMFGIQPKLLSAVVSILHAPHMMAEGDDLCQLFRGALLFLQSVLFSCCVPWDWYVSNNSSGENESELYLMDAVELSAMIGDLLERMGVVVILSDLMHDEYPFSVRHLAVQILFAMLLRGGSTIESTATTYVRDALSSPERLNILLSVITSSPMPNVSRKQQQQQQRRQSQEISRPNLSSRTHTSSHDVSESDLLLHRLHTASCIRELANTHFAALANTTVLDIFQQLMLTEKNGDLRALAIEVIYIILLQSDASFWKLLPFKKELVAACVTQLEQEQNDDALRATLSLVETLILKDTVIDSEENSGAPGSYSPIVCETLLSLFADRALALLVGKTAKGRIGDAAWDSVPFFHMQYDERQPQNNRFEQKKQIRELRQKQHVATKCIVSETAVLAARCLRVLIQHAPPYCNGAFYLMQHFSSSARLLEVTMRLAEQHEARRANSANSKVSDMDELKLVLSVELAVLMGFCLAQDSRARKILFCEFSAHPSEARHVRHALISNLNLVKLSYFGNDLRDFCIKDAAGAALNALDAVSWDTLNRPSRAAVHNLFASQENRVNSVDKTADTTRSCEDDKKTEHVQGAREVRDDSVSAQSVSSHTCHQRLTFIILSYAIHHTFKFACDETVSSLGAGGFSADVMSGPSSKSNNRRKKVNKDTASHSDRYYKSFLIDTDNDSRIAESTPPKQEEKSQLRELRLSPVPQDPKNSREGLMSPSRPPWLYLADGAMIAVEKKKKTQERQPQGGQESSKTVKKDNELFQQYQRGLQLFIDLAQFYSQQPTSVALAKNTIVYDATTEGLYRRQGQRKTQETLSQFLDEETSFKGKKPNENNSSSRFPLRRDHKSVKDPSTQFWSIEELQEDDLFYFCIPYKLITLVALRQLRRRAEQHAHRMKKLLAITPQSANARHWFLHDALVNIIPGIIHTLSQFIQWFDMYGEETVKLPVLIFFRDDEQQRLERERLEAHEAQRQWHQNQPKDHIHTAPTPPLPEPNETSLPSPDAVSLHAGNLIPLARQIAFYLQRREPPATNLTFSAAAAATRASERSAGDLLHETFAAPGGDAEHSPWHREAPARRKKLTLLNDIDREMARLRAMEFGDERAADLTRPEIARERRFGGDKVFGEGGESDVSEDEEEFDELNGL